MRNFFLGVVATLVVLIGGAYIYARMGLIDTRADQPVSSFEATNAMAFLDASTARHAPERKEPAPATEQDLRAGLKIYEANCAGCHGDAQHPQSQLAEALYPRAPQFLKDPADMADNENFYIIKHGLRWTGMPAWGTILSDGEIWQLSGFLKSMDKLPPAVEQVWKNPPR